MSVESPNPIDVHVGHRIMLRRKLLGMTQEVLAKVIGVSFQQVQKYERGANRVSASRLWMLAEAFNVEPNWFFEDLPNSSNSSSSIRKEDPLARTEIIEMVASFTRLPLPQQEALRQTVFACAAAA